MINVAIVGCGQIGSRHLQALANLEEEATIYLVDSFPASLSVAHERFGEVWDESKNSMIHLKKMDRIESIDKKIDVAIISSNSAERARLTEDIINHASPKYLILEKFLFQRGSEYDVVKAVIEKNRVKAYVNQWISSNYMFCRIAQWLGDIDHLVMKVSGNNWGLSCNSVHFIDYFDMLTGRGNLKINESLLEGITESKRPGYYEFNGSILVGGPDDSELVLSSNCGEENDTSIYIDIRKGEKSVIIKISQDNKMQCMFEDNKSVASFTENTIPFQSNITHRIVQRLMLEGKCDLPAFERSSYHHLLVLPVFEEYVKEKTDIAWDSCPIT